MQNIYYYYYLFYVCMYIFTYKKDVSLYQDLVICTWTTWAFYGLITKGLQTAVLINSLSF